MDLRPHHRFLGSTGITVSPVGLGTVKFGRNRDVKYPAPFELPGDDDILQLLAEAKTLGINLLDTAPAYGESETRLGRLVKDRADWVICTKVGEAWTPAGSHFNFTPNGIRASISRSLERLRTDILDIVLVHSDGGAVEQHPQESLATLSRLKADGIIRAFGFSPKTAAGVRLAASSSDVLMTTYTYAEQEVARAADEAIDSGVGIIAKKILWSGHAPTAAAFDKPLTHSGVSTVVVGTLDPEHLRQNVLWATQALSR
jgi:aryl-alcohol dehydrogenase-like predicted oxidoreductase